MNSNRLTRMNFWLLFKVAFLQGEVVAKQLCCVLVYCFTVWLCCSSWRLCYATSGFFSAL